MDSKELRPKGGVTEASSGASTDIRTPADSALDHEKLSGHERQVHERNHTKKEPSEEGYTSVPPGEKGQYGMRRDEDPNKSGASESGLPLNPGNTKEKRTEEKDSAAQEKDKDPSRRDNPYGGDRRYEADFGHSGYGGPGIAADKG